MTSKDRFHRALELLARLLAAPAFQHALESRTHCTWLAPLLACLAAVAARATRRRLG